MQYGAPLSSLNKNGVRVGLGSPAGFAELSGSGFVCWGIVYGGSGAFVLVRGFGARCRTMLADACGAERSLFVSRV